MSHVANKTTPRPLALLGALEIDQLFAGVLSTLDYNYKFINIVSDASPVNRLAARMESYDKRELRKDVICLGYIIWAARSVPSVVYTGR